MMISRRDVSRLALGAAGALGFGTTARAAVYPDRPVHCSVGFAPGSGADILCRYYAHQLELRAKQPFILDNRAGATGNIALRYVARAEPDGYNLLFGPNSNMAGSRYLFKDNPFDTLTDFTPVASFAQIAFCFVVGPTSPIQTIAQLVAKMKSKPDNIFGYSNQTGQLSGQLFQQLTGTTARAVSYKSTTDALKDIIDNSLDFMVLDGTFAAGVVNQGLIRALAVTTRERSASFPNTPTMIEAGVANFDFSPWWALYVPAKTPQAIIDQLALWMHEIAKMPETAEFLKTVGSIVNDDTGPQADARLRAELPRWEALVKAAGIEPQ